MTRKTLSLLCAGNYLSELRIRPARTCYSKPRLTMISQLLRKDLRSAQKQIIAANMPLTDAEAQKFWPAV